MRSSCRSKLECLAVDAITLFQNFPVGTYIASDKIPSKKIFQKFAALFEKLPYYRECLTRFKVGIALHQWKALFKAYHCLVAVRV